jgi:hypothetical protein
MAVGTGSLLPILAVRPWHRLGEHGLVHNLPPSLIEKELEKVWLRSIQFCGSGETLSDDVDGARVKNINQVTSISISRHHGGRIFRAGERIQLY